MRSRLNSIVSRSPRRRGNRRGFTLIELLLAVAISVFIVGALYALFTAQSRQFLYQDSQQRMHQNLRFAMDLITRTARMAGYGTGGEVTGALGFDTGSGTPAGHSTMPAVISWDAWSGSHDAITITYADPTLEMMTAPGNVQQCGTTGLYFPMGRRSYASLISNYSAGEYLLCWDYAPITGTVSYMWEISSAGDAASGAVGLIQNNPGDWLDYDALCSGTANLPAVLHCSRGHVVTFYIDDTDDGVGPGSEEHPVLMMDLDWDFPSSGPSSDDIPLVDDIEDLQIAYCAEGLAGTLSGCDDAGAWQDSLGTATGPYDGTQVWMVRVSLVSRSAKQDKREMHVETRPNLENHSPTAAPDSYYRQVLTTAVSVRNLRYQYAP